MIPQNVFDRLRREVNKTQSYSFSFCLLILIQRSDPTWPTKTYRKNCSAKSIGLLTNIYSFDEFTIGTCEIVRWRFIIDVFFSRVLLFNRRKRTFAFLLFFSLLRSMFCPKRKMPNWSTRIFMRAFLLVRQRKKIVMRSSNTRPFSQSQANTDSFLVSRRTRILFRLVFLCCCSLLTHPILARRFHSSSSLLSCFQPSEDNKQFFIELYVTVYFYLCVVFLNE